jgi:hypothetical protein
MMETPLYQPADYPEYKAKIVSMSDSVPTNFPVELPVDWDARFCEVMDVAPVMIWVSVTPPR